MDIKKKKGLGLYEPEELKHLDKSLIAKAIYNNDTKEEPKEEIIEDVPYWKQRLTCKICGKQYFRSATTKHRRTQYHKTYELINEKLRKFMLE